MSTQTEITRLQTARNKLRTWLVGRGLAIGGNGQVQHLVLGVLDHIHGDALLMFLL